MEHKQIKVTLIDNRQYNVHYIDWGKIGSTKVLVCVHGLTRNCRDFDFLARKLSREYNYRVIAIDMPGRGRSDWLSDPNMYNYDNYKLALLAILDQLNLNQIDYLGSSMGGIIAMHVAQERDNVFNKLILNDVGTFIPKKALLKISKYVRIYPNFKDFEQAKSHLRVKLAYFGIITEENWDYITFHSIRSCKESNNFALDYDLAITNWMIGLTEETVVDIDLALLWEKVRYNKLLLLRGKKSELFLQENALDMIKNNDNASLIEFENTGHTPSLMEDYHLKPLTQWIVKD